MSPARKREALCWTRLALTVLGGKVNGRHGQAARFAEQARQVIGQLRDALQEPLDAEIGLVDTESGSRARDLAGAPAHRAREAGTGQSALAVGVERKGQMLDWRP